VRNNSDDVIYGVCILIIVGLLLLSTFVLTGRIRSLQHRVDRLEHVTQQRP
jgi:hypothetical protein